MGTLTMEQGPTEKIRPLLISAETERPRVKLGFSTGCLYQTNLSTADKVDAIRQTGCQAIEISFLRNGDLTEKTIEETAKINFSGFDHVSLHAPIFEYGFNYETRNIFEAIRTLTREANLVGKFRHAVFHPDTVQIFGAFYQATFQVAFENMNNQKMTYKEPEELQQLLTSHIKFAVVFDVNHLYSNCDYSDTKFSEMVSEFYALNGRNIVQIHLSGYTGGHQPLFETRQSQIIRAIQNRRTPIIVESVLEPNELVKEQDYILQILEGA